MRIGQRQRFALFAACTVAAVSATAPLLAAERVEVVARTGAAASGAPNTAFGTLGIPIINGASQVAFSAALTGSGATAANDTGVWLGSSPLTLAKIVREGDGAPGTAIPTTFSDFRTDTPIYSAFNDAGQVGLTFTPLKSGTNSAGYAQFAAAPGAITLINRTGEPYPAPYSGTWHGKMFLGMNNTGRIAVGDLYDAAFVGTSPTTLTQIARVGQPAPGVPGATFDQVYPGVIYLNDSGALAFGSRLRLGNTFSGNTLFAGASVASITKVAAPGDAVPALGAGYTLSTIDDSPSMDRSGQILVAADADNPAAQTVKGLWLTSTAGAPLRKVALSTDQAPGFVSGVKFNTFSGAQLAAADVAVFSSTLTGPGITTSNDSVLWQYEHGALKAIAQESAQAPGAPAGTKLSGFSALTTNVAGQAVFTATITSTTSGSSTALFGYDASLGLTLLAKKGDTLQFSPADSRTIASLTLALLYDVGNNQDGQATVLNDAGIVAYRATFTDNSQAILTTRVPVAGDTNYDGIVDTSDLNALRAHYAHPGTRADGDFNSDGIVNFADFQLLERNLGRRPPPLAASDTAGVSPASVPEPAVPCAVILGVGALTCRAGRRR